MKNTKIYIRIFMYGIYKILTIESYDNTLIKREKFHLYHNCRKIFII